jgi:hypothetical protein
VRNERGPTAVNFEVFKQYFLGGQIAKCEPDALPVTARDFFEDRARMFGPKEYAPGNFTHLFLISHPNGDQTFVATETKNHKDAGGPDEWAYLMEYNSDGVKLGSAVMRRAILATTPHFADKPYADHNNTETDFIKHGLAIRRLKMMNALSQMLYRMPLNSDIGLSAENCRRWEKLVAEGQAVAYKDGDYKRFAFIQTPPISQTSVF